MPIYAYKCASCGHAADVLQRLADAPLTECPACGAATFSKQLTAAGFQLKGSGWYATDFRNKDASAKTADAKPDGGDGKPAEGGDGKAAATQDDSKAAGGDKKDSGGSPAPAAPSASAPAPASGGAAAG